MRALALSTFATLGLALVTFAPCSEETEEPTPGVSGAPGARHVTPKLQQAAGPPSEQTQAYVRHEDRRIWRD